MLGRQGRRSSGLIGGIRFESEDRKVETSFLFIVLSFVDLLLVCGFVRNNS